LSPANPAGTWRGDGENVKFISIVVPPSDPVLRDYKTLFSKAATFYNGSVRFPEWKLTVRKYFQVLEAADLPPTDWSTGLTDPFVKVSTLLNLLSTTTLRENKLECLLLKNI
jgi:hypothetical protein